MSRRGPVFRVCVRCYIYIYIYIYIYYIYIYIYIYYNDGVFVSDRGGGGQYKRRVTTLWHAIFCVSFREPKRVTNFKNVKLPKIQGRVGWAQIQIRHVRVESASKTSHNGQDAGPPGVVSSEIDSNGMFTNVPLSSAVLRHIWDMSRER